MRSGHWRGISLAIAMAIVASGTGQQARAGLFHKTIPREVLAMDYRTGDVMMAPPIPTGCYTADPIGCVQNAAGATLGCVHGLIGKAKGLCTHCGGPACGQCGGKGWHHGQSCNTCGGDGCGKCGGLGLLHGHGGSGLKDGGLLGHDGHGHGGAGVLHQVGAGVSYVGQGTPMNTVPAKAAPQSVAPSSQMPAGACGGCLGTGKLLHGGGCGMCGGSGLCGRGGAGLFKGLLCGRCKGAGCGDCMGDGSNGGLGHGGLGHGGLGHGNGNGGGCGFCGGRGCSVCAKARGLLAKICHKGEIKYFTGPGGPVPLTPGYVPYVNVTKSPRDYFAYPPFSDQFP